MAVLERLAPSIIMIEHSIILGNTVRSSMPKKALFLDRDGVLIHDVHYIRSKDDVVVYDNAYTLLAAMRDRGYLLIVVTNQSGISRGYSSWSDYSNVTDQMLMNLGGLMFDAIIANSELKIHDLTENWRKPASGMFHIADKLFNIDFRHSIMIGDRLSDLEAAFNSGIRRLIHVQTGHGLNELSLIQQFVQSLEFTTSDATLCYAKSISDLVDL